MVRPKKRRTDLVVPASIKVHWDKGHYEKNSMADVLLHHNGDKNKFIATVETMIEKTNKVELVKDCGWYSESEMKSELGWSASRVSGAIKKCQQDPANLIRSNEYDNVLEYWIVVRETGKETQAITQRETERKVQEATDAPTIDAHSFDKVKAFKERSDAQTAVYQRFQESLLNKCTKLRSLVKDLRDNYGPDAKTSIAQLESHIAKLESEYRGLSDDLTKAEADSNAKKFFARSAKDKEKQSDGPKTDFESREPRWRRTMNTEDPFDRSPHLFRLPFDPDDKMSLVGQDLFHGWHLGAGKTFMASALALFSAEWPGRSLEARFDAMVANFFQWCKDNRQQAYIRKLTRDTINWKLSTDFPTGGWSKGSTTLVLMRWFISACRECATSIAEGSLLRVCFNAALNMNLFLSKLYREQVWIESSRATEIADHGFKFLHYNALCAKQAFDENKALLTILRTIQRALLSGHAQFVRAGWLLPDK
ncbi:unnamed protein product, partial [Symbiodinium necroappetens]